MSLKWWFLEKLNCGGHNMLQIQGNLFARKKLFLRISKSGSNGKGIEEFNYDFGNTIVSNFLNDISKKKS